MRINLYRIGGALGLLAVALGAFGAHALKPLLMSNLTVETFKTAVLYHFIHALLILSLASSRHHSDQHLKIITTLALAGTLLFSGSLYLLATVRWMWLGPITPIGGLLFITAWSFVIFGAKKAS